MGLDNSMNVAIEFEYFLSQLYGHKFYHGFVGIHSIKDWKKECLKILRSIEALCFKNIEFSDQIHSGKFAEDIRYAIQRVSEAELVDHINAEMIAVLTKTIFNLMDSFPNRWELKFSGDAHVFETGAYRTLTYIQTAEQKQRVIHKYWRDNERNLQELREISFKGKDKAKKFVECFKKKYSKEYLEIF